MKKRTGLVLSGGGARGIAHIGVLKAMEELEIKIDAISGVSAGAIFGAFYSSGLSIQEMMDIASSADLFDLMDFRLGKPGLFKSEAIRKTLEKNLAGKTFENLNIPLTVAATDFGNAKTEYFTSGNLINCILASSSIPVIFQPQIINNKVYVDGGVLNNFPVEPLTGKYDVIIGIHVNPVNTSLRDFTLRNVVERSLLMAIGNTIPEKVKHCSVFIEPVELHRFHIFDMNHAGEISEIGYQAIMAERQRMLSFYS